MLAKPNFVYYSICLLIDKENTQKEFKNEKANKQKDNLNESFYDPVEPTETVRNINSVNSSIQESNLNLDVFNTSYQQSASDYENNLYEEFNEKNLLSFKASTNNGYDSEADIDIICLDVTKTETSYEVKTGKQYTSYNIKVNNSIIII